MTQEQIYSTFKKTREHFIDITGMGNWTPLCHPELAEKIEIPCTKATINSFCYCPFCGAPLENNKKIEEHTEYRYTVWHYDRYYANETLPEEWYGYGENSWEEAMDQYNAFTAMQISCYICDNEYGVTFKDGEWN